MRLPGLNEIALPVLAALEVINRLPSIPQEINGM